MIAVGFLVAYDFEYLKHSLPCVYDQADKIVLALDAQRKTFTGNSFYFDETFKQWVQSFDRENKISWLEKSFYQQGQSAFENVMKMRNELLNAMQPAQWFIQLDTDEYFLDFASFIQYLKTLPSQSGPVVVQCAWKTIFKKHSNQYLMIAGRPEHITIASNKAYNTSERNIAGAALLSTNYSILHQSWARNESEIRQKINNWSHSQDFNTNQFFKFWCSVNKFNYRYVRYFHPLHPPIWPYLEKVKVPGIEELIEYYRLHPPLEKSVPRLSMVGRLIKRLCGI